MTRRILVSVLWLAGLPSAQAATLTFTGGGGNIPDFDTVAGVITSDIVVADPRSLFAAGNNVTVTLLGLQHDYSGDLIVTLTYIGGVTVSEDVFNRIGIVNSGDPGFASNFGDPLFSYVFRSDFSGDLWGAAGALGDADPIPGGQYGTSGAGSSAANNLSSLFNSLPAAGTWRLTISDNSAGDTGSFTGWQLDLDVAAAASVPEPSLGAMVGLVLAGICARRAIRTRESRSTSR